MIEWLVAQLLQMSPPGTIRSFRAREELRRPGDLPTSIQMVLHGIGCRYSLLPNGQRQITALLLLGDVIGFDSLVQGASCDTVSALTSLQCAHIPASVAAGWIERRSSLGRLLWQHRELQAAMLREWVINVGARPAAERIAHFFCETMTRSRALGLSTGMRCALPMTQIELADVAAVTPVHVNRILMQLKRDNLACFRRGVLEIPNLGSLSEFAGFGTDYLEALRKLPPSEGDRAGGLGTVSHGCFVQP